jgi:hypothetical protein
MLAAAIPAAARMHWQLLQQRLWLPAAFRCSLSNWRPCQLLGAPCTSGLPSYREACSKAITSIAGALWPAAGTRKAKISPLPFTADNWVLPMWAEERTTMTESKLSMRMDGFNGSRVASRDKRAYGLYSIAVQPDASSGAVTQVRAEVAAALACMCASEAGVGAAGAGTWALAGCAALRRSGHGAGRCVGGC